jgi:hypothetical protein
MKVEKMVWSMVSYWAVEMVSLPAVLMEYVLVEKKVEALVSW